MSKVADREWSKEYKEYIDQLNDEQKKFIKNFYNEYYNAAGLKKGGKVLKEGEVVQEAYRNVNRANRDAFFVAEKTKSLLPIESIEDKEFMEEACDEWDWERMYKTFGINEARRFLIDETIEAIAKCAGNPDRVQNCFNRYYNKRRQLERFAREKK